MEVVGAFGDAKVSKIFKIGKKPFTHTYLTIGTDIKSIQVDLSAYEQKQKKKNMPKLIPISTVFAEAGGGN